MKDRSGANQKLLEESAFLPQRSERTDSPKSAHAYEEKASRVSETDIWMNLDAIVPHTIAVPLIILCIMAALVSAFIITSPTAAQPNNPSSILDTGVKNVLILHSYESSMAWTKGIQEGIESVFKKSGVVVDMHIEYMDTIRHRTKESFGYLEDLYRKKYDRTLFDVILLSDNNALDFLLPRRDKLFPGVPIVFCGVNDFRIEQLHGQSGITGVNEDIDIYGTIELALRIMPKIKKFLVISDRTATGLANRRKFEHTLSTFTNKTPSFELLDDLTTADLQKHLGELSSDSAVLLFMFRRDKDNRVFTPPEYFRMIVEGCNVPVFTFWFETSLGTGVTGGVMVSGTAQGERAAEYALRILKGETASSLPFIMKSPNVPILDYQQLKKFNIPKRIVPAGVVIQNEQIPFYYRYKKTIWLTSILVTTLIIGNIILLINIARRREAEAALRESEEWYRMIYNHAPVGIMHFDSGGITIDCNDNFTQIMGADREQLLGFNMIERLRDQAMLKAVKDTLDGQNGYYEGEYLSVTGQRKTFLRAIFQRITDNNGKLIGAVGIYEDITERKRAEQLLQEREALLNKVGTIAKIGGWEMDMATGKATWTKGTYDIVEIDYDNPIPGLHEHVGFYLPEYREMIENTMETLIETKQPMMFEAALKTATGNIKWCQAFGEAVVEDEQVVKLRGTFQDITDRKKIEEEIKALNRELEQRVATRTAELAEKTRQMETFTYSVSHDLKAPLRGIDGYSRLLLEDHFECLDEEGRTFLTTIRQATEQMRQLIEDLLAYSRMERRELASHEVHPFNVIQTLLAERTEEINARNVSIIVDMPDIVVKTDPEGLAQILRNLLDNALKFTDKTPAPHIEIGGQDEEGKHYLIWVRDNGIGFDMCYHDRIFEIFQRLHSVEEYPGTGIGMAIVQKAIQRMGGRVWAESAPGKGATFYLEVPK